ncbi:unnamed protein product [Arabis nemorensis]|uniref:Uncharacterized protein n=1 Tax=Arabis nemorensis TaxID=586526 RepID=A0A565AX62_9BRAS|nr:unnamed protein product [Arabis nemorensis]
MSEDDPDGPENSSQNSTQRTLTIDEKDAIFLKEESIARRDEEIRRDQAQRDEEIRRDQARRDEEHRRDQERIAEMERLITFLKNSDPRLAAFMSEQPDNTPTTEPVTAPTTAQPPGPVTTSST